MKNYAFVILSSNDLFVPGAVAAAKSLQMCKTKYPVYCMVTDEVSDESIAALEAAKCSVMKVPKIGSKISGDDRFTLESNWLTFTKLNVFNLTQFDKVVYLDADTLVLKNVDDMLDFPALSGYCLAHTGEVEAGVLVIEPNEKVFNDLMEYKEQENWLHHDQTLINWYFRVKNDMFHHMNNEYHYCHKPYHNHNPFLFHQGKAKVIEFNGHKPWIPDRWVDGEDIFYKMWNAAYNYEVK